MGFMKELTAKYGLESRGGQAWGFIDGYWFQIEPPGRGGNLLRIRTAVSWNDDATAMAVVSEMDHFANSMPGIACDHKEGSYTLEWRTLRGFKTAAVESFLLRMTAIFRKAGAPPACFHCNSDRTDGFAMVNGAAMRLCSKCHAEMESSIAKQNEELSAAKGNYPRGFLGAAAGALLGSVAWIVIGLLGRIAAIAGFAIAFCAVKGYQLMKGKVTRPAIAAICLICLAVMLLAQFFTFDLVVYNELHTNGRQVAFSDVLAQTFQLPFYDSEVSSVFIRDCVLGLAFMALGSFRLIRSLFKSSVAPAGKFERL